ncbi:MAG: hypothetical protein KC613_10555 [Myxococcales bacterium]|nr:hypothetical protein [Myxococcales bacterium]MCB9522975.1 hypothetical protein [Myxococcales bacterium]
MQLPRPWSRWTDALIPFAAVALAFGCTEDSKTPDEGDPSLTIVASNACGRNILPITTLSDIQNGTLQAVDVVVTGTDPFTDTRQMVAGTPVVLSLADDSEGSGRFISSRQTRVNPDDPEGQPLVNYGETSEDLSFLGRSARDQFFCTSLGTVNLTATVTDYSPGGTGPLMATINPIRNFPIRCVPRDEFLRACGLLDASTPLPEMGPEVEMGTEMGGGEDMGQPDAAPLSAWTVRYQPTDDSCPVVGIRGSGGRFPDNVVITFQVVEAEQPVADVPVAFEITGANGGNPPNGILVRPEPNLTGSAALAMGLDAENQADLADEAFVTKTNNAGVATVRVIAGGTPGTFAVRARAYRRDQTDTDTSCAIVIRGGIPSGRGMQLLCDHEVIPAFSRRELLDVPDDPRDDPDPSLGARYLVGNEVGTECRVQLADRVNGRVPEGTRVFFLTEAGTVTQEAAVDEEGGALTVMRIGHPGPRDVDPDPWEEALIEGNLGPFLVPGFNPRDGLVRVVAFTRGEEDFRDMDGDKIWDPGLDVLEPGMDLGEPFIDEDDNGTWTENLPLQAPSRDRVSEEFRDTNGNGFWDEPNEDWDANTEIWTSTTVLWVGNLHPALEENPLSVCCVANDPGCMDPIYTEAGSPRPQGCNRGAPGAPGLALTAEPPGLFYLMGRFHDDNGNCLGGRGLGVVELTLPTDMSTSGRLRQSLTGSWCFAGFERPRARPFFWPISNLGTEDSGVIEVSLTHQGLDDAQFSRKWGVGYSR